MTAIIAKRLARPADDLAMRLYGAAASAAFRVVNEELGAAALPRCAGSPGPAHRALPGPSAHLRTGARAQEPAVWPTLEPSATASRFAPHRTTHERTDS